MSRKPLQMPSFQGDTGVNTVLPSREFRTVPRRKGQLEANWIDYSRWRYFGAMSRLPRRVVSRAQQTAPPAQGYRRSPVGVVWVCVGKRAASVAVSPTTPENWPRVETSFCNTHYILMSNPTTDEEWREHASTVTPAFKIGEEVYLIGSLERGVTVYGQQVRAHNLMWALSELDKAAGRDSLEVAIIGGGITGLTAAACVLSLSPSAKVTVFERSYDLCSLQQGCDTRWLHPRVYDWPYPGTRAPSASLPVLNWSEGRASDVADQILQGFAYYIAGVSDKGSLTVYLGLEHLKIGLSNRSVEWVGRQGILDGAFVRAGSSVGEQKRFDRIVLTIGFGAENTPADFPTPTYWQNDKLAQLRYGGRSERYLISGYGDGALIDLCRLTIERFRQDRILYDLFGDGIEQIELALKPVADVAKKKESILPAFQDVESTLLIGALAQLRRRIRKDTRVILHIAGRESTNTHLSGAFGPTSSFSNRLLLYLLYRCGAFVPHFGKLGAAVNEHALETSNVICRYGPETMQHLEDVFSDPAVKSVLNTLKNAQGQQVRREWKPGSIPSLVKTL